MTLTKEFDTLMQGGKQMGSEMQNNIDDIPVVERAGKFNKEGYDGYKTKIATVTPKQVKDLYPNGDFDANSTKMKQVIEIATYPLKELDADGNVTAKDIEIPQEDGSIKKVIITHRFNLQEQLDVRSGKTIYVISKHPKASLWKFMRKKDAAKLSELKDKVINLTLVPSNDPEKPTDKFLSIVVA